VSLRAYLNKMRGTTRGSPPRVRNSEILWSWIGGFLEMALVAWTNHTFFTDTDTQLLIGSFGASAVLVYGAVRSPLAQPRNLVGGHIISAAIGVTAWILFQRVPWLAAAMAVATAIAAMHPPWWRL
jgi:CBS-domain-containing membrane protein